MADLLLFLTPIVFALVFFGGLIWQTIRRDRERNVLVAEITARGPTVLWITEDGRIHTTYSLADTADVLEQALDAVRTDMTAAAAPELQEGQ